MVGTWPRPDRVPERTSQEWLDALRASGPLQRQAMADLHRLLMRAARLDQTHHRAALSHVRAEELEDLALQAADDAMVAVLAKLDEFRGKSRFTTWAYKFALLEAGVTRRRRSWQGREVVLEPAAWSAFADRSPSTHELFEHAELLNALRKAIDGKLTRHQQEVFVSLALNEVPIDVLADRLQTSRGALYKTLHDARQKLRAELAQAGFGIAAEVRLAAQAEAR